MVVSDFKQIFFCLTFVKWGGVPYRVGNELSPSEHVIRRRRLSDVSLYSLVFPRIFFDAPEIIICMDGRPNLLSLQLLSFFLSAHPIFEYLFSANMCVCM